MATLADPPLVATLATLDHQNFPFIYLNVRLDDQGGETLAQIPGFSVTENGALQTDYFQVTPPEASGGVRLVDIVFIMDNSGSMQEEQNAVRESVDDFVSDLAAGEVDYALGLCRFGAEESEGQPILEDAGVLTSDPRYFRDVVWSRNVVGGGYEPGWDALYEAANRFSYRPGAQRVLILITDETITNDGRANAGAHSQSEVISRLQASSIAVFSLVNLSAPYETPDYAVSDYGVISKQTNGAYFDIFTPFSEILRFVSIEAARTYLVTYKSSVPVLDGMERRVTATVSYQGTQAMCEGTYVPGAAPKVQRTEETIDLGGQPWAAGTPLTIGAKITDSMAPLVESATLHYRRTGDAKYISTGMIYASGVWSAIIPGGAVEPPGCDYYISATDGQATSTTPTVDPRVHPHQVAVLPNAAPEITHTTVASAVEGAGISISAGIVDTTNTVTRARLWYRTVGELIYRYDGDMTHIGGSGYAATIPGERVSIAGVQYYIEASDDLGVSTTDGAPDVPHTVKVSHTPVVIIHGIMGSELVTSVLETKHIWVERRVWPHAMFKLADPGLLKLTREGQDSPGTQVRVLDIIQYGTDLRVPLPHLHELSVYGELIRHFLERGYSKGSDLFIFAYDWRKDLTSIAALLADEVRTILSQTGAAKVDVIAHSMGGVVARQYMKLTDDAPVRKLVLLGVPSYGSPEAFQALHPELGLPRGLLSGKTLQELSANFPAAFQLLPTKRFFELYGHILEDNYSDGFIFGPLPGQIIEASPDDVWENTYGSLADVNDYLLRQATFSALRFHESLGDTLRFVGETYIVAGSGNPTKLVYVKKHRFSSGGETTPAVEGDYMWTATPTNGDGTVPLLSVTRLDSDGPVSVFHTKANHTGMLNDEDVHSLVFSIVSGAPWAQERKSVAEKERNVTEEGSLTDGSRENQAYRLDTIAAITIKSPVELHIYDSAGNHIGPDPEGFIETTPDTDYFHLGENTIAYLPEQGTYELELRGLATGTFGVEFSVFDETAESDSKLFSLDSLPTMPATRAKISYQPSTRAAPILHLDLDGDGTPENTYVATATDETLLPSSTGVSAVTAAKQAHAEISVNVLPEVESWLTIRTGGASDSSWWVSPIAITLGTGAVSALRQMSSAQQLLAISLLASLESDGQLEDLVAAFTAGVGEFLAALIEDPLALAAHAGILPPSIPRTVLTRSTAQDAGILYWYEKRMLDVVARGADQLHIILPLHPQYQVPVQTHGFTGFVFLLDVMLAPPIVTPADTFLYFDSLDEEAFASSEFTLGKANTGPNGALAPVENRYEWSYARCMWIEPED